MAAQIVFGMIGLAVALYVLVVLILPYLPAE
jgi:phage shock protein PspC (stress-responsive transcriptional regulator)